MNVEINDWINMTKIMYYLVFDCHDGDNDDDFVGNNLKEEEMLDEVIE
jgi:hypothetical protein